MGSKPWSPSAADDGRPPRRRGCRRAAAPRPAAAQRAYCAASRAMGRRQQVGDDQRRGRRLREPPGVGRARTAPGPRRRCGRRSPRAAATASGSSSTASTARTPSRAAAIARMPDPVPRSSMRGGRVAVDHATRAPEASGGAAVVTGAERAPGLDRDHDPAVRRGHVPRRRDQQPAPDGARGEVRAPGVRPVLVGQRADARVAGGLEAERAEPVEVCAGRSPRAYSRTRSPGRTRAAAAPRPGRSSSTTPRAPSSHSELVSPSEGRASADAELPVAGAIGHRLSRGASSSARRTPMPAARALPSRPPRTPPAPRAVARSASAGTSSTRR